MAHADALTDEERLTRFLKTGSGCTFFLPGKNKVLQQHNNPVNHAILMARGKEAVDQMITVRNEESFIKLEPLIFALALAAHSTDSEVKQYAQAAVSKVCKNPVELFMYLKHNKILGQFTKGWGRGHKKAVVNWYNSKDPYELAQMVTRYKSYAGWTHEDVFRLSHITPANEGIGIIVKYILRGLEAAKEGQEEASDEVKKILKYFEAVHTVKHSEDGVAAARLLEMHNLYREHVPNSLMSSKEVWNTLLKKMCLQETLDSLTALARLGYLTVPEKGKPADELLTSIQDLVLSKVKDPELIEKEKISPFTFYVTLKNYTKAFSEKDKKLDKAGAKGDGDGPMKHKSTTTNDLEAGAMGPSKKKKKKKKKGAGDCDEASSQQNRTAASVNETTVAVKTNPQLYNALQEAFKIALEKNVPVTDKRYLLAVKTSVDAIGKGIRGLPVMSPLEVMALMATFYKQKEKNRELGYFTASYNPMKYHADTAELLEAFATNAAPVPHLKCDPAAPITWALEKKKKYDVFLIMSDGNEAKGEVSPAAKLIEYREKMNMPDTKVIICGLTSARMDFAQAPGMLDIGGFDKNVPILIYKFIEGKV